MKFEETMAELEDTVRKLESGSTELDEALALFERGIKLSNSCKKMLDRAEKKVSVLLSDENGNLAEKPFDGLDE